MKKRKSKTAATAMRARAVFTLNLNEADSTVAYSYVMKAQATKRFAGNPKKLLDIGCGWGRETLHYKNAVGLDINSSDLKEAKQYSDNEFVCGDAEHLPFRGRCFDFIIMTEVIEHLHNPVKAVDEIKRVLEEKGRMVIQTLNRRATKGIYTYKDHIHEFTVPELKKLLNKHGFKVSKQTASTIPFIPYGWKRVYHINFNKIFLHIWRILNMVFPIKWDIIILAEREN